MHGGGGGGRAAAAVSLTRAERRRKLRVVTAFMGMYTSADLAARYRDQALVPGICTGRFCDGISYVGCDDFRSDHFLHVLQTYPHPALQPAARAAVTAPPPSPPPVFTTSIRLPPHRLDIDEAKFLRLLCYSFSLHIVEKRAIIRSVPRLRQDQADGLIRIFEDDEAEQERRNASDPQRRQDYEQTIGRQLEKWRWLERKIADWP